MGISNLEPNGTYAGFGGTVIPPNLINTAGPYYMGINFAQGPLSSLGGALNMQWATSQSSDPSYRANLLSAVTFTLGVIPNTNTVYLHNCCSGGTLNLDSGAAGGISKAGYINSVSPHAFGGGGVNTGNSPVLVNGNCPVNGKPEIALTPSNSVPTWQTTTSCTLLGMATSVGTQWFMEGHIAAGAMLFGIDNTGKFIMGAGATVSGNTVPGIAGTPTVGKAVCWKTATTTGYCSTQPDSTGSCTCN